MKATAKKIRCPRCDSENVTRLNNGLKGLQEFECKDKCFEEHKGSTEINEYIYFQYENQNYSWPAVGVLYLCHEDDLKGTRAGKIPQQFV